MRRHARHARGAVPADDIGVVGHVAFAVGLIGHRHALVAGLVESIAQLLGGVGAFADQLQRHPHAVILAKCQAVRLDAEALFVSIGPGFHLRRGARLGSRRCFGADIRQLRRVEQGRCGRFDQRRAGDYGKIHARCARLLDNQRHRRGDRVQNDRIGAGLLHFRQQRRHILGVRRDRGVLENRLDLQLGEVLLQQLKAALAIGGGVADERGLAQIELLLHIARMRHLDLSVVR
jgi:hypothetical protein